MKWNKFYTSPSRVATMVFGELFYREALNVTADLTGVDDHYGSYLDREAKVLSEHVLYEENERKYDIGYEYFTDPVRLKEYKKESWKIIKATQRYIIHLDKSNFNNCSITDLKKFVHQARPIYNNSLGYYFVSQPEYTAKFKDVIFSKLEKYVDSEKLQETFVSLVESEKLSSLEEERLDWLNKVVIPHLEGRLTETKLKESIIKHQNKYKYLAASAQSDPWTVDHFQKVLEDDLKKDKADLVHEANSIDEKVAKILKTKKEVISQYSIGSDVQQLCQIIADLGLIRLELHIRGWQFFQYFGPVLVRRAAELLDAEEQDVFNLTFYEFLDFIEGELKIDDKIKERRGGNILVLNVPPKRELVYFGEEAVSKYKAEVEEKIDIVDVFDGQVANGKGKIKGEVFLLKWGDPDIDKKIYSFPEGKILVAGQTLPLFMPAIRKASAILTDEGGVLCHAAIVSRELNKPAIIGTKIATEVLKDGDVIELDLDSGTVKVIK